MPNFKLRAVEDEFGSTLIVRKLDVQKIQASFFEKK